MKYLILLLTLSAATGHAQQCLDTDGDGWGWDGTHSCRVNPGTSAAITSSPTKTTAQCIDSDNDGWGWDGTHSCQVQPVTTSIATKSASVTNNKSAIDGITDVVVMMGQSNALGHNTLVNLDYDHSDERIVVWTKYDGWQVADLCTQVWQGAWFPATGGACGNHPAFQIAKGIISKDPSRKVAVIPAGDAGKPITSWGAGAPSLLAVKHRIETALAQLPNVETVDLVAWSQGESDNGNEYNWYNNLTDLIYRLRFEDWFDSENTRFIAQETAWSTVNNVVVWLNSDNDPLTGAVLAADQPLKDYAHFSGDALRVIGHRYAAKYLQMGG